MSPARRALLLACCLQLIAPGARAAGSMPDGSYRGDDAWQLLKALETTAPARTAGSPGDARARAWALRTLAGLGFERVRAEPFTFAGWTRVRESAAMLEPELQPLAVAAFGNSVSTPEGGLRAAVVRVASIAELMALDAARVRGCIVFVDARMARTRDGSGYMAMVPVRTQAAIEAARRGAVAALVRSATTASHDLPHTGGIRYAPGIAAIPAGALAPASADRLAAALARGPVSAHLELATRGGGRIGPSWDVRPGTPAVSSSANIVAEIPGSGREIVLIGAHLDAWDLGTGAADDAAGVAIAIAAAHRVAALPGAPPRTVRLVLFGAEESGAAGAHAYAREHAAEAPLHSVAVEADLGAARVWRLQTRFGPEHAAKRAAFMRELAPLGIEAGDNAAVGAPDLLPLMAMGVPAVTLVQEAGDYYEVHHSAADTGARIDREALAQATAAYAAFLRVAVGIEGSLRAGEP